jgi:hypothetical protein
MKETTHLSVGHVYYAFVAFSSADMRQADTSVPSGTFYDGSSRLESGKGVSLWHTESRRTTYDPSLSALVINPRAALSFTLPPGFWNSAFPYI